MKFTNTQPGPRGLNTINGPMLLDPKQTLDNVEVYEREKAHIEAAGWFTVEGNYTANPPASGAPAAASVDASEVDRLKAELAARDVEIAKLKKPSAPGAQQPTERDTLKARATALKVEFAASISTDKLKELVAHAEIEALSDTDLKTFLGTKGVAVQDETRAQLIELAKAA